MRIVFKKAGLLSTVQDLGRVKYLAQAVPVSGMMDQVSARIANKLVGNMDNAAVIEFTYGGIEFTAVTDLLIAFSGLGKSIKANNDQIPFNKPVFIPAGAMVSIQNHASNCRIYLAIAGGWDVPVILESRSTFLTAKFGGFEGRRLKDNDELKSIKSLSDSAKAMMQELKGSKINYTNWGINPKEFAAIGSKTIRVIAGNEANWFDDQSIQNFYSMPYKLTSNCNRMGYHLEGVPLSRNEFGNKEMLSTAVTPGTIQVTGNGSLILLMADCQTTGGYPRIAKVAEVDMPLCGQLKAHDVIHFEQINWNEAEMLYLKQEKNMLLSGLAIKLKYQNFKVI
jgi:antagonist of KipI